MLSLIMSGKFNITCYGDKMILKYKPSSTELYKLADKMLINQMIATIYETYNQISIYSVGPFLHQHVLVHIKIYE